MKDFEKQGGVSFLIIYYSARDRYFYQPFSSIYRFWSRMEEGGRKSFTFEEIADCYEIFPGKNGVFLHYLEALQKDLEAREE